MSGATSSRSYATLSRPRSRWRKEEKRKLVHARAELATEERILDALVGAGASATTRDSFRKRLRAGELDDKEIEIEIAQAASSMPMFELPNMPGSAIGAISIGDIFGKTLGNRAKPRRTTVKDAIGPLVLEESDKLIDQDQIVQEAIRDVENNGIVFLDEIDKICAREGRGGARRLARRRATRSSAAHRRHHRLNQAWRGEDRPYPVHRVGRLPCLETIRPVAGIAGKVADPGRTLAVERG